MSFIDFARGHGVDIEPSKFFPSQKIQRCGTVDKPRSGNGAFFWDGQRGWVMDWSGEARVIWFEDPNARPWTEEEKRSFALKRAAAASEQDRRYQEAAQKAESVLRAAKMDKHPYLQIKGFEEELGLVLKDFLLIPMRNVSTNRIQGYQAIKWNLEERKYEKKMMPGMRAKNAVFFMGERDSSENWLVEGYATGLSVRKALKSIGSNASVVVTFSSGNLVQVADQIPGRRFIFADNDASQTGQKAAEETGLPWVMSDTIGEDANDLHLNKGLFSVVEKIMQCKMKKAVDTRLQT